MTFKLFLMSSQVLKQSLSTNEVDQFDERGFWGAFTATSQQEINPYTEVVCENILESVASQTCYPSQNRHLDSIRYGNCV
jgi:hypothetical protein